MARSKVTAEMIAAIEADLDDGVGVRACAREYGVCRDMIRKIKDGLHPIQLGVQSDANYERCPLCGGKVIPPCRACRMKRGRV